MYFLPPKYGGEKKYIFKYFLFHTWSIVDVNRRAINGSL